MEIALTKCFSSAPSFQWFSPLWAKVKSLKWRKGPPSFEPLLPKLLLSSPSLVTLQLYRHPAVPLIHEIPPTSGPLHLPCLCLTSSPLKRWMHDLLPSFLQGLCSKVISSAKSFLVTLSKITPYPIPTQYFLSLSLFFLLTLSSLMTTERSMYLLTLCHPCWHLHEDSNYCCCSLLCPRA